MHSPKISLQTCLVTFTAVVSLHAMAVSAQTGDIETIELRRAPGLDPGGASGGVASGDLPSAILVLEEGVCPDGIDEGRAMMELIHDVAPGAAQAFHTGFRGTASFAQGIIDLANRRGQGHQR
jgi:hypothetical protein